MTLMMMPMGNSLSSRCHYWAFIRDAFHIFNLSDFFLTLRSLMILLFFLSRCVDNLNIKPFEVQCKLGPRSERKQLAALLDATRIAIPDRPCSTIRFVCF